jgi:hypothetical protein
VGPIVLETLRPYNTLTNTLVGHFPHAPRDHDACSCHDLLHCIVFYLHPRYVLFTPSRKMSSMIHRQGPGADAGQNSHVLADRSTRKTDEDIPYRPRYWHFGILPVDDDTSRITTDNQPRIYIFADVPDIDVAGKRSSAAATPCMPRNNLIGPTQREACQHFWDSHRGPVYAPVEGLSSPLGDRGTLLIVGTLLGSIHFGFGLARTHLHHLSYSQAPRHIRPNAAAPHD